MKQKLIGLFALLCIVPTTAYATGLVESPEETEGSAVRSLNDEYDNIDYKVDYETVESLGLGTVSFPSSVEQNRKDLSDNSYLSAAKAYLIENNVLSRPNSIKQTTGGYTVSFDEGWMTDDGVAKKSDVYTMLYKSVFGTLEANPVVLESGGDYWVYNTPDVYELYLNALLNKGLVVKSDLIADSDFLKDYESNTEGNRPAWYNDGSYFYAKDSGKLGKTFHYQDSGISRVAPEYFQEEGMSVLELMELVEQFMRFTEKDMTTSEAKIVAYKYGITYLSGLADDEYNTVAFLVAKGVVNLEEDSLNFFDEATYADVYKLVYRVANTDARYDFSKIQLTDGEAFWQAKGYSAEDFNLFCTSGTYLSETLSVEQIQTQALASWYVSAASSTNEYSLVKVFDQVNDYTYRGKSIQDLYELSEDSRKTSYPEITNIEDTTVDDTAVYKVTFTVSATSEKRAVQIVDSKMTCNIKDASSYTVSAVTRVEADGTAARLISQSALRKCFGDTIEVIEDKVLRNVNSSAMACLLQDSGYALVGNEVVVSDDLLVTDASNDVYYNLDVIASLVGIKIDNMFTDEPDKVGRLTTEYSAPLYSSYSTDLGYVNYIVGFTVEDSLYVMDDISALDAEVTSGKAYLYNVNQVSNGISTVWRKFYKDFDGDGQSEPYVVLVDWTYRVPNLIDFNNSVWNTKFSDSSQFTLSATFNALYKEPANDTLKMWWQSNLGMSNALANMIFGTKNVEYVKCGYMVPNVTILLPQKCDQGSLNSSTLSSLLVEAGFTIPGKYKQYVGGSTSNFLNSFYTNASGITNETAHTFALANRRYKAYVGTTRAEGLGTEYGIDYYLGPSGVLYRNFSEDYERFAVEMAAESSIGLVTVRDRVAVGEDSFTIGTIVTYKNKRFYYCGTYDSGTGTYLKLVPLDDISRLPRFIATPAYGGEDAQYLLEYKPVDGCLTAQQHVTHLYELYFERMASDLASDKNLRKEVITGSYEMTYCVDDNLAANFDKTVYVGTDHGTETYNYYLGSTASSTSGTKAALYKNKGTKFEWYTKAKKSKKYYAIGIPYLYLPAGSYYLYNTTDDSGKSYTTLGEGVSGYALNMSNIRYSGIVDGVIDSILAKSVNTTELKNLAVGTKLIIGDTIWTKSSKSWVSDPIRNSDLAIKAKEGNVLTGMQEIFASELVANDGVYTSLSNYVESATLSSTNLGKVPDGSGCVCKDSSGNKSVYLNGEYKGTDTAAEYTVVSAAFDDSMLVRAITADGSVYRFCNSATESVVGGVEYPFFNEQLSYSQSAKDLMSLSQSSYEMTAVYNLKKDEFNAEYQKKWFEDFTTLIRMFIVIAASWLMIISWIVYWTVSKGYCVRVLEALAGKSRFGKNTGVDLVKLVSFGMYNLDSPPVFARIFIVSIICVVIDAICLALG